MTTRTQRWTITLTTIALITLTGTVFTIALHYAYPTFHALPATYIVTYLIAAVLTLPIIITLSLSLPQADTNNGNSLPQQTGTPT